MFHKVDTVEIIRGPLEHANAKLSDCFTGPGNQSTLNYFLGNRLSISELQMGKDSCCDLGDRKEKLRESHIKYANNDDKFFWVKNCRDVGQNDLHMTKTN